MSTSTGKFIEGFEPTENVNFHSNHKIIKMNNSRSCTKTILDKPGKPKNLKSNTVIKSMIEINSIIKNQKISTIYGILRRLNCEPICNVCHDIIFLQATPKSI